MKFSRTNEPHFTQLPSSPLLPYKYILFINLNHPIRNTETQDMLKTTGTTLFSKQNKNLSEMELHFDKFLGPMRSKFEYIYFKEICSPRSLVYLEI